MKPVYPIVGITELRILISNTGRGGELAILTSIIHAYRQKLPNAYIRVVTCHNGIYHKFWENSEDIDEWIPLEFRNPMPTGKVIKDPIKAEAEYLATTKNEFDYQEKTAEYDLSPGVNSSMPVRPIIDNIYRRLKYKPFGLADIDRRVFLWPSDEENETANGIFEKYGTELVLISHIANSASPMLNHDSYQQLADELSKDRPVAFTGASRHKPLKGHIDLRGTTFSFLYALSLRLKYYIGPDTATSWIMTRMPGKMISLRGDTLYPIGNSGLKENGFRKQSNTVDVNCRPYLKGHLGRHGVSAPQELLEKIISEII